MKLFFIITLLIFSFSGCQTVPPAAPGKPEGMPGIYHRVEKGQTLWKISKMYDVDLDELISVNHVNDITNIEIGQLLFIPNRRKQVANFSGSNDDFIWPIRGRVTVRFNQTYANVVNKGINIEPTEGVDVVASRAGRVVFYSPDFKMYGRTIILDHGDGFMSVYAGVSRIFVKTGENVSRGMVVASLSQNNNEGSSALHFEIRKGHIPQNPYFYLPR